MKASAAPTVAERAHGVDSAQAKRARRALVLGGASVLTVGYMVTAVNIAFPAIEKQFASTPRSTLSWGITGYSIVVASLLVAGGRLADLKGRRRLFLWALGLFGLGSAGLFAAPWAWLFIAGRCVQGVGAAVVIPAAMSLVLPEYPDSRRAWVAGMMSSVTALGQAFAPTVAAVMVDVVGWRGVFLPGIVASASGVWMGRSVFRESIPVATAGRIDVLGIPLGSAGVGLVVFAVTEGPRWGWSSPAVVAAAAGAVVLLTMFALRSSRHARPMIDPQLFVKRAVWSSTLGVFLASLLAQTIWFVVPLHLHTLRGYSPLRVGLSITPLAIGASLGSAASARLAHRVPLRRLAILGSVLLAAGTAVLIGMADTGVPYAVFVPPFVLTGLGMGFSQSPLAGLAIEDVDASAFGQVNGIFQTMRFVGLAMGVAVAVAVLGNAEPIPLSAFGRTYAVFCGIAATCAVMEAVLLPRRRRPVGTRAR